ncbi:MAG: MBL fold metallo-hydrolase, partial [Erysipelotrichia bacterium]|nr:MBL fold metallo-hydrolase [Erysipelotrichia bacterium]
MSKVRIFALGGLDEDGKNMYVVENNDDIYVIECGMKYPEDEQLGIEMVIPDFHYLVENRKRIKGIFITHGHDDVMGSLCNLLKEIPEAPVFTAPLTAKMFERNAKKAGLKDINIHRIRRNSSFKIGKTEIRTFGTTQSIA